MDFVELDNNNLNIDSIISKVKSPKCGAISIFIGTTRDNFNNLTVSNLSYDAYNAMAIKAMKNICSMVREKWSDIVNIAIVHRLGTVEVTEPSVVIAIASPHRKDSLAAVEFAINTLKSIVPIWKLENYADNTSNWKENEECSWSKNKINE